MATASRSIRAAAELKAQKSGPHHTVFWVTKKAPRDEESKHGPPSYAAGSQYMGDWADNRKEGFGTLVSRSGSKYEGDWAAGLRHGKGTYWVKEGGALRKQFTGDWQGGKKHGLGIFYYKNGDKYEGQWQTDVRAGRGKMLYAASGEAYEGDWADDKRSGMGVHTLANGDRYEGHFRGGVREGPGRFFYRASGMVLEGEWVNDVSKCGVMMSASEAAVGFSLPPSQLAAPSAVLSEAVAATRRARAQELGAEEPGGAAGGDDLHAGFTEEEIMQVKAAFDACDPRGTGFISDRDLLACLVELGMQPMPEDVAALKNELGVPPGTVPGTARIAFLSLVDVLTRLRV